MIHLNASQQLGLGVAVTLALSEIVVEKGIALSPSDLGLISEQVVSELLKKGEAK